MNKNQNRDLSGLPDSAILRLPDVLRLIPVSRSTWWAGVKSGLYPKPIKIGKRACGWLKGEVLCLAPSGALSARTLQSVANAAVTGGDDD